MGQNQWYTVRKQEHTGQLSHCKQPGRPQKTTAVKDLSISNVNENPILNVKEIKDTLQDVGIDVLQTIMKTSLHQHPEMVRYKIQPQVNLMSRMAG